jgi:hypothetical protein
MNYNKMISTGALIALAGFVLSGPIALAVVMLTRPQPVWISAEIFAQHYHVIQDLPYFLGFLLISGMLMVVSGHYLSLDENKKEHRSHMLLALSATIVFSALIAFNYICQTTFVRNMALHYSEEYDAAISAFSMANPLSFCWANEMWGYAFLGIATWLMAGYYADKNKIIQWLLRINGWVSIAGVIWTIIDVFWVKSIAGLAAYFLWNVLMIVLMVVMYHSNHDGKLFLIRRRQVVV